MRLLVEAYRSDPDPGIHGAVRWTLLQLDQPTRLAEVEHRLATGKVEGNRRWYVSGQGQTFTVIPGPVEFWMGSPDTEAERERGQASDIELQHFRRIHVRLPLPARRSRLNNSCDSVETTTTTGRTRPGGIIPSIPSLGTTRRPTATG